MFGPGPSAGILEFSSQNVRAETRRHERVPRHGEPTYTSRTTAVIISAAFRGSVREFPGGFVGTLVQAVPRFANSSFRFPAARSNLTCHETSDYPARNSGRLLLQKVGWFVQDVVAARFAPVCRMAEPPKPFFSIYFMK